MQRVLTLVIACLLAASPALAAGPAETERDERRQTGALVESARREAARLARAPHGESARRSAQVREPGNTERGWIGRHPVLVGALIGAGAGAAASMTMDNELFCSGSDEDCLFYKGNRWMVGAGMGAGVGALVGLIVDLSRPH